MRETYMAVAGIVATDPQVRDARRRPAGDELPRGVDEPPVRQPHGAWVDGHTLWVKVSCWRELADNASQMRAQA